MSKKIIIAIIVVVGLILALKLGKGAAYNEAVEVVPVEVEVQEISTANVTTEAVDATAEPVAQPAAQ